MINATPEVNDFTFKHSGIEYAVGYQEKDDVFALSALTGDTWAWVIAESYVKEYLTEMTVNEYLTKTYAKFNEYLKGIGDAGLPPQFGGDLKKLLLLVKDNTSFANGQLTFS